MDNINIENGNTLINRFVNGNDVVTTVTWDLLMAAVIKINTIDDCNYGVFIDPHVVCVVGDGVKGAYDYCAFAETQEDLLDALRDSVLNFLDFYL